MKALNFGVSESGARQSKSVIGSEGLNARKGEESHPNEMLQLDNKITKR